MINIGIEFARNHILLTSLQHFAGGFGLAILLQHYLEGTAFAPLAIGWAGVLFSVSVHAYELLIAGRA